jgi:ketosteroid isomerase-like protein
MRRFQITTVTNITNDEAQIRALIDDRINAVRAKDVDAAMANVAPDVVSFDVVNPLRYLGAGSSRQRAEEWIASLKEPIGLEISDLTVAASCDVAFAFGLSHVSATRSDGGQLDMWWRVTLCFRKSDGKWIITHEHNSVPFDVENGKASLDLKPGNHDNSLQTS